MKKINMSLINNSIFIGDGFLRKFFGKGIMLNEIREYSLVLIIYLGFSLICSCVPQVSKAFCMNKDGGLCLSEDKQELSKITLRILPRKQNCID